MPFTTPLGWLLLVLALVVGWLLGAAASPSGRKWHKRFREREVVVAKYRREMEKALIKARERVRQLERGRETETSDAPPQD